MIKRDKTQKGMWKRTIGIYRHIRIPWMLYAADVVLGIAGTKVALLYIPYLSQLETGDVESMGVLWAYVGLMLLNVAVRTLNRVPAFYAESMVTRDMQNRLVGHALRLPMRTLERTGTRLVSWVTQDATFVHALISVAVGFITGLASLYMSVTSMQAIDTSMLFLVPFILAYILFSTWFEGKCLFLRQRRERVAASELTAYMSEHLGFFTQIKQLHSRREESERGRAAVRRMYDADIYAAVITLVNNFVSGSLNQVITILVFVLGVPLVNAGAMTITELQAFRTYVMLAYQSLQTLPGTYTNFMYYNGQLFNVANLMAEREEDYAQERTMDMQDQDLVFDHVSFAYGQAPVIKDASFTIPKGKVTMIAGPNGSGKTTLFKLIERFYTPESGTIRFGPHDVRSIQLQEWRQSFAYVLQDPQFFNGTIRDNINYGMGREVAPEETESAAKLACADGFIRELPGGYDFVIGENGSRLSAGQRQRIAIARAVMLDPAYLLLDEATCNMDIYSEAEVNQALRKLMKNRTTVMISHDMKMLKDADHVVVLNGGVIEGEGPREEVVQRCGLLKQLVEANT